MTADNTSCLQSLRKACRVDLETDEQTVLLSIYQEVRSFPELNGVFSALTIKIA